MRKYLVASLASMAVAGSASAAPLPTIQYTQGVYTVPASTTAAIFEEFEGGVARTQYLGTPQQSLGSTTRGFTQTTTGSVLTEQGNVPGDGFTPDPDNNNYLAVQAGGLFAINLAPTLTSAGSTVFSFVFGTLDTYNTLRLFFQDGTSQLRTGAEIIGLPNTQLNPSTYAGVTGRVTFDTGGASTITRAEFGSTGFDAFEIDSLAAAVPEPGTWAMMILGFALAGGALRSRRRKVSVSFA